MNSDGSNPRQLTDPNRAGEWGNANLPIEDYDPKISPDVTKVVFERIVGDQSTHGNYDLFRINLDGTDLVNLTESGYSQGLADWSPSGNKIAYIVAAIEDVGKYDIYLINPDGTGSRNITPKSAPAEFLVQWVSYGEDDNTLYFIGEWWSE
jgi:TolB protein